jgi:hypothetical protein
VLQLVVLLRQLLRHVLLQRPLQRLLVVPHLLPVLLLLVVPQLLLVLLRRLRLKQHMLLKLLVVPHLVPHLLLECKLVPTNN